MILAVTVEDLLKEGFSRVVDAGELTRCECDEPWCPIHGQHYSNCPCIGPSEDGVEYRELNGVLFGRRTTSG